MNGTEDITGDPGVSVFGSNEQREIDVDVARYVGLARLTLAREQVVGTCEMSLIFCDEDAISRLNEQYMDSKGPTDVLAFPVDDDIVGSGRNPDNGGRGPGTPSEDDEIPTLIGDVYVCPAVARAACELHNCTLDEEIGLLVVHGTLHLLNYDHYEIDEREEMRAREQAILTEFFRLYPVDANE